MCTEVAGSADLRQLGPGLHFCVCMHACDLQGLKLESTLETGHGQHACVRPDTGLRVRRERRAAARRGGGVRTWFWSARHARRKSCTESLAWPLCPCWVFFCRSLMSRQPLRICMPDVLAAAGFASNHWYSCSRTACEQALGGAGCNVLQRQGSQPGPGREAAATCSDAGRGNHYIIVPEGGCARSWC